MIAESMTKAGAQDGVERLTRGFLEEGYVAAYLKDARDQGRERH
jgi:hypothetical protein